MRLITVPRYNLFLDYCIQITSSSDEILCGGATGTLASAWSGDDIELYQNGDLIHTFQTGFTDEQKCLDHAQVDENQDQFELRSTGTDEVSYFNLNC